VLRQDGQPIEPSRPLLLTQKTELALWQGEHLLGTLTIHPGAEDLTLRNQRVAELRGALNAALQAVGVADFDAAEAQAQERSAILQQVQTLREQYKASAPRGIEALQAELQRVDAQLQQLSGVEESGEAGHEDGGEDETLASQLAELCAECRRSLQQVQSAISQAQTQVRSAQLACQEHTNRLALLQGEVQSGSEALQAKEAALIEAQSRTADADLQQALRGAQERLEVAEARALAAQADLAKAEPLKVEEELRARGSEVGKLRMIGTIPADTPQQVARLEGELGGLAQQDLREREERLQAQLQREQTVAAQQSQQAEALRLLHEVLLDAERRAREDFMLPVERRVEHYLQKLWPGSKPQFSSADYALSELQRGGISEPFNALSIGTREQLAVISRLAVADLLHKQGQPTCLLFDDILFFADDRRFQIMLAALKDAAQTQQILILTCRGRDYANQDLLVRSFPESTVRRAA
jgi:uncharacterized protein YhaN